MSRTTATDEGSILRTILIVILALLAIPFVMMVLMMPMMGAWGIGHMNGWMWNGTGTSWVWIVMWIIMLAILLGGGYLLYRGLRNPTDTSDPALEELRMAYARGELSDEEFEERRDRLRRS